MGLQEFQAVILAAGRGSRMTDLTSVRPKCLLPLGGFPILWHSIKIFEKAGFLDVTIVVLQSAYSEIEETMSEYDFNLKIELFPIQECGEDLGTADSLKMLLNQDKIKTDVVVASCDLFTNESLNASIDTFRKHSASFVALMYPPYSAITSLNNEVVPGPKSKYKPEKDIIGIDSSTSRLVFLASASDFEQMVPVSLRLLRRHHKVMLRTDLLDGHLYVLARRTLKFLLEEKLFSTLKGEFLPYIVKKQYTNSGDKNKDDKKESSFNYNTISNISTFTDHNGDLRDPYLGDEIRCYAVIAGSDKFGIRLNSAQTLCQANILATQLKIEGFDQISRIHETAEVKTNQIDEVSVIGKKCLIMEKTSIKNSTFSDNCVVQPKTRVTKCIVMNGVKIGEGCILENCIVCDKVTISPNCELKDCIIGAHHIIPEKSKYTAQVLTKSDHFMEI